MRERLQQRPLLGFAAVVIALLPACFLVWHLLAAYIASPAVLAVTPVLTGWLGNSVESVLLQGTDMLVVTRYGEIAGRIAPASASVGQLAYPVDTRLLSYSIPFYAALHFATPLRDSWTKFGWNLLWLWLLLALGLLSTTLKNLMLGAGTAFMATEAVPPGEVIALLYQLSTLIVPTLAPVLLWAYAAKDSPVFAELLPASPAAPGDDDNAA